MPDALTTPAESPQTDDHLKDFSCVICRQRKIKCDRQSPCSNCVKAEKTCEFIAPVRGKRKRTKPPKEGLHAKLRRYEERLEVLNANVDAGPSPASDGSIETRRPVRLAPIKRASDDGTQERAQSVTSDASRADDMRTSRLIKKGGKSRYFDSTLWTNLGDGFQHPECATLDDSSDGTVDDEEDLLFEIEPLRKGQTLKDLHPPLHMLQKIKEVYIDRVDCLIKIIHLPSFFAALAKGSQEPQALSKPLEALAFAFYFAAICSLPEDKCESIVGLPRSVLYPRYRRATQRALKNAGLMSTCSVTTLQAYALFLMCIRNGTSSDALYIMTGVAVRLARKMGLHKDGANLKLSPFDTEIRRRLWWQIVHTDFRLADVLGAKPSLDLADGDTKLPLNVNDDDLYIDMPEPPKERNGITDISLCLIRCEIFETVARFSPSMRRVERWEAMFDQCVSIEEKDALIREIENHLEQSYLRYCDVLKPFHVFMSIMMRSSICKLKLFAHNLRRYARTSTKPPQIERDIVFENATKLLEYIALLQESKSQGLDKYLWQIGTSYLWSTMLYILIEMKQRKIGPEVDRVWHSIFRVFPQYPEMFNDSAGAVYVTLGKWTLEVWDEYVAATKEEGLPEPVTPECISSIRRVRSTTTITEMKTAAKPKHSSDPTSRWNTIQRNQDNDHQSGDSNSITTTTESSNNNNDNYNNNNNYVFPSQTLLTPNSTVSSHQFHQVPSHQVQQQQQSALLASTNSYLPEFDPFAFSSGVGFAQPTTFTPAPSSSSAATANHNNNTSLNPSLQHTNNNNNSGGFDLYIDGTYLPALPSFDMDADQWMQWEQLLSGHAGFAAVANGMPHV